MTKKKNVQGMFLKYTVYCAWHNIYIYLGIWSRIHCVHWICRTRVCARKVFAADGQSSTYILYTRCPEEKNTRVLFKRRHNWIVRISSRKKMLGVWALCLHIDGVFKIHCSLHTLRSTVYICTHVFVYTYIHTVFRQHQEMRVERILQRGSFELFPKAIVEWTCFLFFFFFYNGSFSDIRSNRYYTCTRKPPSIQTFRTTFSMYDEATKHSLNILF